MTACGTLRTPNFRSEWLRPASEGAIELQEMLMKRNADKIVAVCASVVQGEEVLIVTDFNLMNSARILAQSAFARGAKVTLTAMEPREIDGQEPPQSVAAAMGHAEVILTPVTVSMAHAKATLAALQNGARVLSLTTLSEDLLASDAWQADFVAQRPMVQKVADMFEAADEVRVTSALGTELVFSAAGRTGNAHACVVDAPGSFSAAPNIEASFSPVEGSANGTFVADGSIPYLGIGLLKEPVEFEIRDGRVTSVKGGDQADHIRRIWEEQNDPSVYNIAQVAVGLNPKIERVLGTLGCNYDEGAYGTLHIGIGTSASIGGSVRAPTHFDALMNGPTVTCDGRPLLTAGKYEL